MLQNIDDGKAGEGEQMVFNTGAALLDAIVLAVVSQEKEGTYGYKITQDSEKFWMSRNPLCIRYCVDFKRTTV